VTIKPSAPAAPPAKTPKKAAAGQAPMRAADQAPADAIKFWDDYFKSNDEKIVAPAQVFRTVAELIKSKNFVHVELALKSFLTHHGKQAEPWMYEWLVKAIEERKHTDAELKTTLGFAAFLAKRTKSPYDLRRVADMLVVRKFYGTVGQPGFETNIGELLDLSAEKEPANPYTHMMAINLALHDKDPKRMASATESLLSLGWPGLDDKVRRDVKEQVKVLEKNLRDDARGDEADTLLARLAESEARDLYIKLTWVGEADIDLNVDEPFGVTTGFRNPRSVLGGAIVKNGYGTHPEEVYVCPRAFDGDYTIRVETIYNDEIKPITEATLEVITHEGTAEEKKQTHKINLEKPAPIVVKLTGGRRKVVLPYIAAPERPAAAEKGKEKPKPAPAPAPASPAQPPAAKPSNIR
jgi:hypothetical protein